MLSSFKKQTNIKTLYVSDLDGTLLTSDMNISENSLKIINTLIDEGMLFTYATARSISSASIVAKGLSTKHPIIAYNGAFIVEPDTRKILAKEDFSRAQIEAVMDILSRNHISPLVYSFVDGKERVSWIPNEENEGKRHYIDSRKGDKRLRPVAVDEELYKGEVFYFTCIGEKEELEPVYQVLKDNENYTCTFQPEIYREEYWLEIMPRKATKANAILKLKELLGCNRIVSFGDAINDIPMFRISDECYAVENAVEELKKMATAVIESNNNDGVAKWLNAHVHAKEID